MKYSLLIFAFTAVSVRRLIFTAALLIFSSGFGAVSNAQHLLKSADLSESATAPQINALSATTISRSGFLVINGTGFGPSEGVVYTGNIPAHVTTWTDTRIVAYVPEAVNLGYNSLYVQNAGGASNVVNFNVTNRLQTGRVRWRLQMDAIYSLVRPVVAADGTVYAIDVYDNLYAVAPDGALKWIIRGAGNKGLTVGTDGTVYTASENDVTAYNPDGTQRWRFIQNPRAFIMLNLQVGPDGNLYGVASSGMGIFSLTPQGALRWTNPEAYNRPNVTYTEIVFSPNNGDPILYFYANAHTRAVKISNGADVTGAFGGGQPRINPLNGNVHQGTRAYAPTGGLLWTFDTNNLPSGEPALAPDGTMFMFIQSSKLFAVRADGTEKWNLTLNEGTEYFSRMDVAPNNSVIVSSTSNTLNHTNAIIGLSAFNGFELWRETLPAENGNNQMITSNAAFSRDTRTAYLHTATAGSNAVSFLYAVNAAETQMCIANCARVVKLRLMPLRVPGGLRVTSYLTVTDQNGMAMPNAAVAARWVMPGGRTALATLTTDANGIASSSVVGTKGNYSFDVVNLELQGYTFDIDNSELNTSLTR